jgi:hypothetical protein
MKLTRLIVLVALAGSIAMVTGCSSRPEASTSQT